MACSRLDILLAAIFRAHVQVVPCCCLKTSRNMLGAQRVLKLARQCATPAPFHRRLANYRKNTSAMEGRSGEVLLILILIDLGLRHGALRCAFTRQAGNRAHCTCKDMNGLFVLILLVFSCWRRWWVLESAIICIVRLCLDPGQQIVVTTCVAQAKRYAMPHHAHGCPPYDGTTHSIVIVVTL